MFTKDSLPKFRPESSGQAQPKPGASVVACKIPCRVVMNPWGSDITIEPDQGYWHCALKATDAYPNNEFTDFYEIVSEANSDEDPRAAFLLGYWKALGHTPKLVVANKTKKAFVVGICDESGTFESAEGPVNFVPGDLILESPVNRGQMWVISEKVFTKKYLGIEPRSE